MKSILISIKPKWVAKILNGEKTIEIRKTMPKCDLPIDVYIYCTKDKDLMFHNGSQYMVAYGTIKEKRNHKYNGKVVAKFTLNSVIKCKLINDSKFDDFFHSDYQLTRKELKEYVGDNDYYEWHISNLEIFDKPKELSEFSSFRKPYWNKKTKDFIKEEQKKFNCRVFRVSRLKPLTKAPQSWCYIEGE